ncbi:DUF4034 domain-containing protein [Hahella ganghwensis]|uniref:DUF4034 domain-containing protein n=1 Tax=Hahella ganghwensis TaxID=286420 RepID=UPI000377B9EF|nr:DUF4034 domain-containing protein [Hahella ganghwensis]
MIYFLIIVVLVLSAAVGFYLKPYKRKAEARQCSYGNAEVYKVLTQGDGFSGLRDLMSRSKSFEDRYFVSVSISRLFPMKALEDWVDAEPQSADALLCYGARLLEWAWEARGDGRGHEVSRSRWETFFERLDKTRVILTRCAEVYPEDPTPWAYLIKVSTWYSDEMEVREHYFEKAIARDKNNWAAHMYMILALSKKWGGDNVKMVEFAESVVEDAEEGSELPVILFKAYYEYWRYFELFEEQPEEAEKFIHSEYILSHAVMAYEKSLGSERHKDSSCSVLARHHAAYWFWLVENKEILRKELMTLGDNIEEVHWYWNGYGGDLDEAKAFALGEAPSLSKSDF